MHNKGYLFLNILVLSTISVSIFSLIMMTMTMVKAKYRERINELDIKIELEARAMQLVNATNVSKKVDQGWIEDGKFYYQVRSIDTHYLIEIKHFEKMEMIYYQIFDNRYTTNSYQYIIYEEGYRGD